jgi:membrane protein insertase Oxa1/YidC/SpoIIIJ
MQLRQHDPNATDQVKMTQRIMLFAMPLVMAFFTAGFPVGVGIFWISSQVFQVVTDVVLLKKANVKIRLPFMKERGE